jgi:hypothetical protein
MAIVAGQSPEALDWYKVYEWTTFNDVASFAYVINNSATAPAFTRILYQIVFGVYSVWCEMDDFTSNTANRTGVPLTWVWDSSVTNLRVFYSANSTGFPGANASTIYSRAAATGKINFWPSDYGTGADGVYDSTDTGGGTSNGYGSFQVFDTTTTPHSCIFAWNQWGGGDIGFGNRSTSNPDWTFAGNAATVPPRLGRVYVK